MEYINQVKLQQKKLSIVTILEGLFITCMIVFMLGCSWFDNDSNEPPLDPPEPPSATFNADVTSGNAPLSVQFMDLSVNGTSPINSWEWDFGDGNTSQLQSPQHTFETAGVYDVSLTVTSSDGSDSEIKTDYIAVEAPSVTLKLSVINEKGVLIDDFTVSSETYELGEQLSTDIGIAYQMQPVELEGVIKISKQGYLNQFLFLEGIQVTQTHRVTLMKRAEPITFDAFSGGDFKVIDGAGVSIPAESLQRSDGSIAAGEAQVYITPIDISDPISFRGFPGSFFGATAVDEEREPLFSYGVVDITFEQNGEQLQLVDGATAEVYLPLYATKSYQDEDLEAGDRIPMWYLDEESGLWIYESNGVVVENPIAPNELVLQANTSHFTAFNADINPPGLGGGSGGGASGGNLEDHICRLSVNLLGAEEDKRYNYQIIYSRAGWPTSSRNRDFTYQGGALTQPILKGFLLDIIVSDGEIEGSTRVNCASSAEVETTITLGDAPPEFINFIFTASPNFTRDANGLSEILTNTILAGGYFIGAEAVTITSDFLTSPLILGNSIFAEVEHKSTDPTSIEFLGTISNQFGSTQETAFGHFSEQELPIIGYGYAYYDNTQARTVIRAENYLGVDNVRLYELDWNIEDSGTLINESDIRADSFEIFINRQLTGFLRMEVENRYGTRDVYFEVSSSACLPGAEDCFPTQ